VLIVSGAAWAIGRRSWGRPLAFGLGYHALMVLPVLGLLDMAYFAVGPVSNHLQYLALAAPCALVGAGLAVLHRRHPSAALALGVAASLVLVASTHGRAAAFEDDLRLWRAAARASPRSLYAASSYAAELGGAVSVAAAVGELEAFIARSPDDADRHLARALALVYLRRPAEAAGEAIAGDAIRRDVQRQIEIGRLLVTSGYSGDAIRLFSEQLERAPRSADVRYWLSAALFRSGRVDEARQVVLDGLHVSPGDVKLRSALAMLDQQAPPAPVPEEARP